MIHLSRPRQSPENLQSLAVDGLRDRVRSFYARAERSRRQERADFPLLPRTVFAKVMRDMLAYSYGKCAYCESPIEFPGSASLDRYRPKAGAIGFDGKFSTEHYWWLAYEWENLLPACTKCNKFKGAKFPVEGSRAATTAAADELQTESRLLLDPCYDAPYEHLQFNDRGLAMASSPSGDVTIATLELNRSELIASRGKVVRELRSAIAQIKWNSAALDEWIAWGANRESAHLPAAEATPWQTAFARIAQLASPERPWSAAAAAILDHGPEAILLGVVKSEPVSAATWAAAPSDIPRLARAVEPEAALGPSVGSRSSHGRAIAKKAQSLRSRVVTRIAVHNFRGIADLDMRIDYESGRGAPWTILLGENAAGKSSILQAVVLALIDEGDDTAIAATPRQVLKKGTSTGWVRVWLDESTVPRSLVFNSRSRRFRRSGPPYANVLLGYGATRLLPRKYTRRAKARVRLNNMFDPFSPLLDANRWLGALDARTFDYVARALKDVLDLPPLSTLKRVRRDKLPGVRLKLFGVDLTLDDLSDGYQSVLGLTCDIIAGLHVTSSGALEAAEGLVVIDELGAHLHPRWRMRIVRSLRTAFPRVQFIASTHDPLCLRGLENGEAIVLKRTSRRRIYVVPDLPPIKGMRVDQILTSEYFGLESSMDPDVERKFRSLYRLLAKRVVTSADEGRIAALREELAPFEVHGATRRERRLLELIDKELAASDEQADPQKRHAIRASTDLMVADMNRRLAAGESIT
ncbi:MAG: hypothetical protein JWL61_2345 [Gemmatimonadetes bacterium]|nr:hypothetical protein [Gemmatimonadota bacterium]